MQRTTALGVWAESSDRRDSTAQLKTAREVEKRGVDGGGVEEEEEGVREEEMVVEGGEEWSGTCSSKVVRRRTGGTPNNTPLSASAAR